MRKYYFFWHGERIVDYYTELEGECLGRREGRHPVQYWFCLIFFFGLFYLVLKGNPSSIPCLLACGFVSGCYSAGLPYARLFLAQAGVSSLSVTFQFGRILFVSISDRTESKPRCRNVPVMQVMTRCIAGYPPETLPPRLDVGCPRDGSRCRPI